MTQKSVESSCCLFHVSRLLHCPLKLNRQRQSPRRYEYSSPIEYRYIVPYIPKGDAYKHIPRTPTVAMSKISIDSLQDFDTSRTERFVNAFIMSFPFPTQSPHQSEQLFGNIPLFARRRLSHLYTLWTRPSCIVGKTTGFFGTKLHKII